MKVIVLGTAAGGGLPQWNCACAQCSRARSGDPAVSPRRQDCLAISATGENWFLLNASPDLREQIAATPELAPGPGRRETPIRGALLTDAELDHTLGLTLLREGQLTVWAPPPVLSHAAVRGLLAHYHHWTWHPAETTFTLDGLTCTVFPLSGKRPRYAQTATPAPNWVVAYRITDPTTGGTLVYAPCLAHWPTPFTEFLAGATHALLDGTFHSPDEMATTTAQTDQRAMGHLPIVESLPLLPPGPTRWYYTHLNNTNPAVAHDSLARTQIEACGASVAEDGTRFDL
ncbi:pyrroloquinoline quinone biosynthesis protein B [Actinokineospora baliensis]|uniref:pyrroloquinoline quinone biosynthesis protein PqqB n=1 Tax=Actinokineospora baliensis TaxID=547056 RepID=UPI00195B645D|nr:pyrroloquinoline quinone biosynthesis protein PqqB [Actinokineospora baliensis]MBM7774145.1 pyrroloquinoline quinone biosynthesis protein B [Actinokineospora baliensis]